MKRGSSGLSLLVGVNKPSGMTSHDVVNRCRRIFGERRCGHTGTLDPLATGVLPICIGPATRLDQYMTSHDKSYRVRIGFGFETTTDDAEGERTDESSVPSFMYDREVAEQRVRGLVRQHKQVPPQYSAVKVDGKKAYDIARSGGSVELEARTIQVYAAELVGMAENVGEVALEWIVDLSVSKGTYIRSLVRDLGREVLCPAHVVGLERLSAGRLSIEHCVSLESLEDMKEEAALDPVRVLGLRFSFGDDFERFVSSGTKLYPDQVRLHYPLPMPGEQETCKCFPSVERSLEAPEDGELACIIIANRLKALYSYDAEAGMWKPACVFSTSIYRG